MKPVAGWAALAVLALLVALGVTLQPGADMADPLQQTPVAAQPVGAVVTAAVTPARDIADKPAESLTQARRRWEAFARTSNSVADILQFCRNEIPPPEREWCLYRVARECTLVTGKSGPAAIAELEAAIASRGRSPVAQQLSQKLDSCRSYWRDGSLLDPATLVSALLAAEHPAIAVGVALRQIPSDLAHPQRARLVEKAWLAADASTVAAVEWAALDALGEDLPADQQFRHAAGGLARCRLSDDCDEDLTAEYERLCDRDLGISDCPLQPTRRALLQAELSPSQLRLAEAYVDELLGSIERGDRRWPPLQNYLRALPPDTDPAGGSSP